MELRFGKRKDIGKVVVVLQYRVKLGYEGYNSDWKDVPTVDLDMEDEINDKRRWDYELSELKKQYEWINSSKAVE